MGNDRRKFLKAGLGGLAGLGSLPLVGSLAGCATQPVGESAGTPRSRPPGRRRCPIAKVTERIRVHRLERQAMCVVLDAGDGLLLVDAGSLELAPAVQKSLGRGKVAQAVQHALPRRPDRRKRAVCDGWRGNPRAHHHQAVAGGRLLRAGRRTAG